MASEPQACAACKHQRRRCTPECELARYFPHDEPQLFRNAHRLFGVSKILKTIRRVRPEYRDDAMRAMAYEADAWDRYEAQGCVRVIHALEHQIRQAEAELQDLNTRLQPYRRQRDQENLASLYNSNDASLLWARQLQPQCDRNNAVFDMAASGGQDRGQCSKQHEYMENIDEMPSRSNTSGVLLPSQPQGSRSTAYRLQRTRKMKKSNSREAIDQHISNWQCLRAVNQIPAGAKARHNDDGAKPLQIHRRRR